MCRRYLVFAVGLTAFGAGLLTGCWIESGLVRLLLAGAAVCGGVMLLGGNCRHK